MKPEIEGTTIFDYDYLYSAYADDTTFFLKYIISIKHMFWHLWFFSYFSGLKPSLRKSEIAGIGVLQGVQVVVLNNSDTHWKLKINHMSSKNFI